MKVAIGIDLGGTNVKGVVINESGDILHQHNIPTKDDEGKWRENILAIVNFLTKATDNSIEVIGIACPGLANDDNKYIAHLPNRLMGLEGFLWEDYFAKKTFVINDAHAALISEAKFGAAKGYKNAVLLTLGTGVGGGILINGELYQGLSQMAGHFGHISINTNDDELSILGMPGSLEYAIGNYAVNRRSMGRYKSTHELLSAYLQNDSFATWLWLDTVRKLAIVLASFSNSLSPDVIVLAGGITKAKEALFNPLQEFMDVFEFRPKGKKTLIKQASFSDFSGAIGAAAFALSKS